MMSTRWARFTRGWVVAVFSTFVAALSHTFAGGAGPGMLAVVMSLAFAGILCVALSGRTLSFWRVVVSVILSQLIFHGLFSLGGSGGAIAAETSAGLHQHSVVITLVETSSTAAVHGAHGAVMWLAHLAAAGVTIAALRYGERALWGLHENARLVIRSLFGPIVAAVLPPTPPRMPTTAGVFAPRDPGILLSSMRHRGPPMVALAA